MESLNITRDIIETIVDELSVKIPYSDINILYNYLETISTCNIPHLVLRFNNYVMNIYSTPELFFKLGSNMFIIVLPLEGQVFITSLDIVSKISGLSLWITDENLSQNILQFTIYNKDICTESTKSPRIIVTDLPSESLTLTTTNYNNDNSHEVVTIHELLMCAR